MAKKLKLLIYRIQLFFQGLAGKFNQEYDDDQGYDPKELEELIKMSSGVNELEKNHGVQTMTVGKDEETDRLGNKRPTSLKSERKPERKVSINKDYIRD